MTTLTKKQTKTYGPRKFSERGHNYQITAEVRYDDECGNGHNSFAITADIHLCDAKGNPVREDSCGCLHEEVVKHFPELAPFIKWHLTSSDGPMHYIANTTYWAKQGNLENARSSAVWPEATIEQLMDADQLKQRLLPLMIEFQKDIESLGFVY